MFNSVLSRLCDLFYRLSWNLITPRFLAFTLLLLAALLPLCIWAVRRGRLRPSQAAALLLLALYLVLLFGATVICRRTRASYSYILRPFWTYDAPFILAHRLSCAGTLRSGEDTALLADILGVIPVPTEDIGT